MYVIYVRVTTTRWVLFRNKDKTMYSGIFENEIRARIYKRIV